MGTRTIMKSVSQMREDSVQAGGSLGEKRLYSEATTFGIKPFMMIK